MVSSVKRPGEKTLVRVCKNDKEYFAELKKTIEEFEKNGGLTAIICRDQYNLERIAAALGKKAPQMIAGQDSLPKCGAFFIELALAKGLEFDNVIIADGEPDSYPDDELGRHCLYTAMSRATQHLAILAKGELSVLVKSK